MRRDCVCFSVLELFHEKQKGDIHMKRVNTKDLIPGMVVAEDVYNYNDQLVLSKGTILNDQAITRLEMYAILSLQVSDDETMKPLNAAPKTNDSYYEKVRSTRTFQFFKREFNQQVDSLKSQLNDVVKKNAEPDISAMLAGTLSLVERAHNVPALLDMLHSMRDYDDSTYVHSLNVALLCNLMARWNRMSDEDIQLATLCGLLHDIGKISVSDEIIKKPARLTREEYALIQEHARSGYNILCNTLVDDHVKNAALMHHERCDGSGYPLRLTADRIDVFAKMVAIADVYDAMTSSRVYRDAICPFKVIAVFEEDGFQCYDTNFILTFLSRIANSYIQTTVLLSDGRKGKVVFINKEHLSKPTVQIGNTFVDLSREKELFIEALC